jgi:hypothetical protein
MSAYAKHVALMVPFESYTPKYHLMFHLLYQSRFHGNPTYYATWLDESLNKTLKAACKHASHMTFEGSVLLKMRELLRDNRGFKRAL